MASSPRMRRHGAAGSRRLAIRAVRAQLRRLQGGAEPTWRVPAIGGAFGAATDRHFHLFPELFLQVRGCSLMRFPGEALVLRPGQALLVPRGMPHRAFFGGRSRAFCNLVFLYSVRHVYLHVGRRLSDGPHPIATEHDILLCEPADEPGRYLNDIARLARDASPAAAAAVRGLFLAHFACLLRGLEAPPPPDDRLSGAILQCHLLVTQSLADPQLSVKTLADRIGCAPDYLSHRFRTASGIRLSRYIHAQRVQQAQLLLAGSAMNVSEVARSCGYRDPGHFARVFRRLTGRAPRAWRRRAGIPA